MKPMMEEKGEKGMEKSRET